MTDSTLATVATTTMLLLLKLRLILLPLNSRLFTFCLTSLRFSGRAFAWFLSEGLVEELESFSPITDYTGKLELHFLGRDYRLKAPKYMVDEAKRRDSTYSVQMYVPTRLINKETGEIKEQEVFYRRSAAND